MVNLIPAMEVKHLGFTAYGDLLQSMQKFTKNRNESTPDEIWVTQHYPVFTLGRNSSMAHILQTNKVQKISLEQSDRGGQITYHAPGQLILYPLLNIKRLNLGLKKWIWVLEESVIQLIRQFNLIGDRIIGSPGVYVAGNKISALGLRISKGSSYHGIALNIDMDLLPFGYINPCGLLNMRVVQLSESTAYNLNINKTKDLNLLMNNWLKLLLELLQQHIVAK